MREIATMGLVFVCLAPAILEASPSQRHKQDVSIDLGDNSAMVRQQAAEKIVSGQANARAEDLLRAVKAESNVQVRAKLLQALGEVGMDATVPALADALAKDPAPLVREIAARTLGRIGGGGEGRKALIAGLSKDSDPNVRKACAIGLAFHHGSEAVKALDRAAQDADPEVRLHAALALSRHPKSAEVDRILDRLERDSDSKVSRKTRAWRGR